MRANEKALLSACIDTGIYAGWIKAHKYNPEPHELRIQEEIDTAIWYEIDQYFVFDSERDLCDEVVKGFDQPEQEEVDRLRAKKKQIYEDLKDAVDDAVDREWVGLTHNERIEIAHEYRNYDDARGDWFDRDGFAQAIEAELKEKNT